MTESSNRARGVAAWTRLRGARARLAAAALLLLAVWEVGALSHARATSPSDADWRAVAAAVPASLAPDQLVVFAPGWVDPVGRRWLGDRLSLSQVARMDTVPYRQVWEVSVRGADATELTGETPREQRQFGAIRLRRFDREAPAVAWQLTEGARVCEIDFQPRLGVSLDLHHPLAQARAVATSVELGSELQVYIGLADYKLRSRNHSKALVQALVDGREVARALAGNDDGWVALPTAPTTPGRHDVEFVARVQEAGGPVDLSVCVAAQSRARRP